VSPTDIDIDPHTPALLMPLARGIQHINRWMMRLGMLALLVASSVLSYNVFSRYVLKASTDWQDETAVFCLVGATFLCGSFVQSMRGHVGIEAIASMLPAWLNRLRQAGVDVMCTLFCGFFAWKSWTLWHEAWAEGQTTSSSWAPPLWIPYGLMALGMTLLTLQLLLQSTASINVVRLVRTKKER
jgi:TRAP-type C4-dicarboxylate transport system permease small subunit